MKLKKLLVLALGAAGLSAVAFPAMALPLMLEGAGGGGLNPWAMIANGGKAFTPAVFGTYVTTNHYNLYSVGANASISKYAEIYVSHQYLGLPESLTSTLNLGASPAVGILPANVANRNNIEQSIVGAKFQVYPGHGAIPMLAVGFNYHSANSAIPNALTAKASGADYYVAATGIYPFAGSNLLLDGDVYVTRSNYLGLLGQGGSGHGGYTVQGGVSVGYFVAKDVAVGAEWRSFPTNNLEAAQSYLISKGLAGTDLHQSSWYDGWVAYMPNPHLSVVAAFVSLGNMVNIPATGSINSNQDGFYLNLNTTF